MCKLRLPVLSPHNNTQNSIFNAMNPDPLSISSPIHSRPYLHLIALAILAFTCPANAQIHIAPTGDDAAPGTAFQPLATLDAARQTIHQLARQTPNDNQPIIVLLHPGTYRLTEPFILTPDDLAHASRPVIIKAVSENVRIVGSQSIQPHLFKPLRDSDHHDTPNKLPELARNHVLQADLTQANIDPLDPFVLDRANPAAASLYVNAQPMTLARWPNEGWARTGQVIDTGIVTSDGNRAVTPDNISPQGGIFTYDGQRPARWQNATDMLLHGFWGWDWFDQAIPVGRIDTTAKTIQLDRPHHYGIKPNHRYYALNLIEELDQPGEYFIDRNTHTLYLWPPAPLKNASFELTRLVQPLIILRNVSNVTIENLTLEMSRADGVHIEGGHNNRIINCTIRNLGKSAVVINGGTDHQISHCEISHLGRGGVLMSGGDRPTLTPANHIATDNHIHHFAQRIRTYQPAIQLNGVGQTAAHNLIHDAPHNAILFGGNDHTIERNEIHDVCLDTGDVGVIYTGRDWTARGTVIRWNYIHDCIGPGMLHGAQGIYLDDCASGIEVTGNIIHKAYRGMLIGGGRDNIIRHNLIINSEIPIHVDARALGWMKHHVQDDGTLMVRLRAMPYQQPPWSERYPTLVPILDEAPPEPRGNILEHNIMVNSDQMEIHNPVPQVSTINHNIHQQSNTKSPTREDIETWLSPQGRITQQHPQHQIIPPSQIGPRPLTPNP